MKSATTKVLALTLCVAGLITSSARSAETIESKFHLFSSKCEAEASKGPESTPQSPPLVVDDPATPGCNHWEFNVVFDSDITHQMSESEIPLLDINYGIGDNIQLKYEVPYVLRKGDGLDPGPCFGAPGTSGLLI